MTPIDRLTCEEVFRRMDDYLDRELTTDEMKLVKEHLDTCAQCAREHAFDRKMLDTVRAKLHHIQAPADLKSRIASAIARAEKDGPA